MPSEPKKYEYDRIAGPVESRAMADTMKGHGMLVLVVLLVMFVALVGVLSWLF